MFCVKCGAQLPEGVLFCTSCGAQQNQEAQPTAAPVAEPVEAAPEAAAENVSYSDPNSQWPENAGDSTANENAPKKGGKKKLIITIAAAVLALALVVGLVAFIVAYSSDKAQLARAIGNAGDELKELTGNAETFHQMLENVADMDGKMTIEGGTSGKNGSDDWYSFENETNYRISIDPDGKKLSYFVNTSSALEYPSMPEYNYESDISIDIYVDEENLMASAPDVLDDYYSLPLQNLGEKLYDSDLAYIMEEEGEVPEDVMDILYELDIDLFSNRSLDSLRKLCPEEYDAFVDTIVVEEVDKSMPCDADCDSVFYVTWDMEALGEFLAAYYPAFLQSSLGTDALLEDVEDELDEMVEDFSNVEMELYFGETDGILTALHFEFSEDGDDPHAISIVLEGRGNVWEDFVVYGDDEEVLTGGFTETDDGFELSMEADGDEVLIICDDPAGELIIETAYGEEIVLEYSADNDGMSLSIEADYNSDYGSTSSMSYSLEILPLDEIETPDDPIDILSLDEDELYDLGEELEEAFNS